MEWRNRNVDRRKSHFVYSCERGRALMRWWKKVAGLATRWLGSLAGGDGIARSLFDWGSVSYQDLLLLLLVGDLLCSIATVWLYLIYSCLS